MSTKDRKRLSRWRYKITSRVVRAKRTVIRWHSDVFDLLRERRLQIFVLIVQRLPQKYRAKLVHALWGWLLSPDTSPYQFVQRCIYCGSTERLSNEHVVPANLGGTRILYKASCETCRKLVHRVETECLAAMRDIRHKRGVRLRRKSTTDHVFKAWVLTNWDGVAEIVPPGQNPNQIWKLEEITPTEHPTLLGLPYFKQPGMSRGRLPEQCSEQEAFSGPWFYNEPFNKNPNSKAVWVETRLNNVTFLRMIAKIAHCFAVWHCGIDGFVPLLQSIILGSDLSRIFFYCGGGPNRAQPTLNSQLHLEIWRGVHLHTATPSVAKNNIIVVVRLFADIGAPVYFVVVGKELPN
jgi:hypothetical protein